MPRLPFIENMNEGVSGIESPVLKITKNGKYVTQNLDKVTVKVKGASTTYVDEASHTLFIVD